MGQGVMLVRGLAKFVAVVAVGLAIGAGLGIGLSAFNGDQPAAPSTAAKPSPGGRLPEAKVLSATLERAHSEDGRRRNRARLSVKVELTNPTGEELTPARPSLVVLEGKTEADPNADSYADGLLEPIPPSASATGTLRFETAGAITQRLVDEHRGTLEIAGRSVVVSLQS